MFKFVVCCCLMSLMALLPMSVARADQLAMSRAAMLFDEATRKHRGDFSNLMRTRGARVLDKELTLDNVQKKLKRETVGSGKPTALLFYDHDGSALRIWAIDGFGEVQFSEAVISREELEGTLRGYRKIINTLEFQTERSAKPKRGLSFSFDTGAESVSVEEVSALLLPENLYATLSGARRLLIVPSLGIGTIPFATLLERAGSDKVSAALIDSYEITMLPSLFDTDLGGHRRYRGPETLEEVLVVGNPAFFDDPDWNFPNLPGAASEAENIAAYFGVRPILGESATKARVLNSIETADVIYLATHGVSSADSPLDDSFIALSGSNAQDSRLTAKEIQKLSLRAKLVVLSACQTGLGGIENAGIIGLSRAFKIAGADEVVVSLWNVDDEITAELMTEFIRYYVDNLDASFSLRKAMISIREDYKDPTFWAPFVLFDGKGSVVVGADEDKSFH